MSHVVPWNAERAVLQLAADQGGFVARSQAERLGMSLNQIRYRVETAQWDRVKGGHYRVLDMPGEQNLLLAATSLLPDAVVSHGSAARLHGLKVPTSPPTVLVHSQTTNRFPNVSVVRAHDLVEDHVTEKRGLPVTSIDRTIVDLATKLSRKALERTLDQAVAMSLTSPPEVSDTLERIARKGKPGVRKLRDVLTATEMAPVPPSVLEARAHRVLDASSLRGYEREYPIPWANGKRFDIAFPAQKVAVELDSRRWHTRNADFDADRARDRRAALAGWLVLRFTWADVTKDAIGFIADIRAAVDGDR